MNYASGEEPTIIIPPPDQTATAVQPFMALRDATQPHPEPLAESAFLLPIWRPGETGAAHPEPPPTLVMPRVTAEPLRMTVARLLGRRLAHRRATVHETLEIIKALG